MLKHLIIIIVVFHFLAGCTSTDIPATSDEADDTDYLQALLDSSGAEIVIPAKETPWITRPLFIRAADKKIIFAEGCKIQAKKGSFKDPGDSLIKISDSRNLVIQGNSAVFAMRKKEYQKKPYAKGEWRHGFAIWQSSNILLEGLTIMETGGDGIYIGQSKNSPVCENITLKNLHLENNHRQGISVTAVKNLLIENCHVTGTQGTPPMAGIDFEPNTGLYGITGCVIKNCYFENNSGPGILVYLKKMTPDHPPVDIEIENTVSRKNLAAVSINNIPKGVRGSVLFKNCSLSGIRLISYPKSFSVRFE